MMAICRIVSVIALTLASFGPCAAAQRFRLAQADVASAAASRNSCRVHVVQANGQQDMQQPCDAPLRVATDDYEAWLETAGRITPFRTPIREGQSGDYELPVVPAGLLRVRGSEHAVATEIWHLELHEWEMSRASAFYRFTGGTSDGVQMPMGRAVGIGLDGNGQPLGVSRPVVVSEGRTSEIYPRSPEIGADLVVIMGRPSDTAVLRNEGMVAHRDGPRQPDVFLSSADRLLGIWYGLEPGPVTVALQSEAIRIDPLGARLRAGAVTVLRATASRLPKLNVTVIAPNGALDKEALSVRIEHAVRGVIRTASLGAENRATLESLPGEPIDVVLSVGDWQFRRSVDLSRGLDESVEFSLEPAIVSGVVTYGGSAIRAEVGFSANKLVTARADESGNYRIVLWSRGRYTVQVRLTEHPEIPPFFETVSVDEDRTFDIEIPRTRYAVRVSEELTDRPIVGAKVTLINTFEDLAEGPRRIMSHVVTGQKGQSHLPPLRIGTLDVRVEAEGFLGAETRTSVIDAEKDVLVSISLKALKDSLTFRIVLPDGSSASSAELLAISKTDEVLYSTTAGADGKIRVPRSLSGVLMVVRHPAAGASVRLMSSSEPSEATWQLPKAAPPLNVRAHDAGGRPSSGSPVFLWLDGHRIGGTALAYVCRTIPVTSLDGTWTARNLPAVSTRVLVVRRTAGAGTLEIDAYAGLAQTIEYPWPEWANVRIH